MKKHGSIWLKKNMLKSLKNWQNPVQNTEKPVWLRNEQTEFGSMKKKRENIFYVPHSHETSDFHKKSLVF